MIFPRRVSFTLTNSCNLRCQMCGQWSQEGYIRANPAQCRNSLGLKDWKRLVDEVAAHQVDWLLLRGGEPFLFPGILELIEYIRGKGIFLLIDTNATVLDRYAADLVRIGGMHITVSVDGPEPIHDQVRGVPGCFQRIESGMAALRRAEESSGTRLSVSICFTISPYSYRGLGQMPEVARRLGIEAVSTVPYYWIPEVLGLAYEQELKENFNCAAFSWRGFHHETSGIDCQEFLRQYREYQAGLGDGVRNDPYLALSEEEFETWFTSPTAPVRTPRCSNIESLIDIQPAGDANFCVDFPDYSFGNVQDATLAELWNSPAAERFREYRRQKPLGACHRCGAKYMGVFE